MEATATGGTLPYSYDWYRIVNSSPESYCLDCGPYIQGLAGTFEYKVIVTDAGASEAEALATVQEDLLWGWPDYAQVFPYIAGELPYLKVVVGGFEFYQNPGNSALVEVTGADIYQEPTSPGQGNGIWWFRPYAASGTITVTYTYAGGQCIVQEPYTIPPPTVIPNMVVLDVQGSCSNAATGSVTIGLYDGVGQGWLLPYLGGPSWPTGQLIQTFFVLDNTTFVTLNGLPPGSNTFYLSGDGTTSSPNSNGFPYNCYGALPFTIPNLGPTCGLVQGKVFIDANTNCTAQANEPGVPGVVMEVQPGDHFGNTDANGNYALILDNGNYTVALQSAVVEEHCTMTPVPFNIAGSGTPVTVNMPALSLVPLDARIALTSGAARPGFEYHVALNARNLTPAPSGAATITFDFDPALSYLSATPAPTNVNGTTLTWNQPQLGPFEQRSIQVRLQVPPDVGLIGTDVLVTAALSTTVADADPTNNVATLARTVTGSFDPNDKLASTSTRTSDALYIINADEWIDYTIRFQNTGTDTAFHVIVTDTLVATLDPATLEIGAASHPFTWELRDAGTLKFRFFDILLPDSNVNEPRSHGFVGFRIRPQLPVLPGTTIENTANIYFDFNDPVITAPSLLTAEFSTSTVAAEAPRLIIAPVPATDEISLSGEFSIAVLLVLDADGRVIIRSSPRGTRTTIDTTALGKGAYLVDITFMDGSRARERFIKL